MCAGNRVSDNASALELDTALAGRLNVFLMKADPKQWLEWAVENNIHPSVLTFIKTRGDMLVDEENFTDTCRRSPRGWKFVSDILHECGTTSVEHAQLIQGIIGQDNTVLFIKTLNEVSNLPPFDQLKAASDQELIRLTPTEVSQLWGLTYSLNATATTIDQLAEAMRILAVMLNNSNITVSQDLLATGMSMMLRKCLVKKDGYSKLSKHRYYKQYILSVAKGIPSLKDVANSLK